MNKYCIEILQHEAKKDLKLMISSISVFAEEMQNVEKFPNFSQDDYKKMKFFDMMKLIGLNSEYIQYEDLLSNLIICFSVLMTDQNNFFEYLQEKKIFELLFYFLQNTTEKTQSLVQ